MNAKQPRGLRKFQSQNFEELWCLSGSTDLLDFYSVNRVVECFRYKNNVNVKPGVREKYKSIIEKNIGRTRRTNLSENRNDGVGWNPM